MPQWEQYPDSSERFGFIEPSFFSDLAAAEFEVDQPYELELYAQQLRGEYDEAISQQIPFIATGKMLEIENGEAEEQHSSFYGRIVGFDVVREPLGDYRLLANLANNDTGQRSAMIISAREGYGSSLLADNLYDTVDSDTQEWEKLERGCFTPAELLGTAASKFYFKQLNVHTATDLRTLEYFLGDTYGIRYGQEIEVTGTQSYRGNGEQPILQGWHSLQGEASYVGTYLGITLYELTTKHGRKESRMCVAMQLPDETVVLQPCHATHSIKLAGQPDY